MQMNASLMITIMNYNKKYIKNRILVREKNIKKIW